MSLRHTLQSNFSTGVITPHMFTRSDLDQYNRGFEQCDNWLPLPHGGITTRPGSEFVAKVKAADTSRLLPFIYSTVQNYAIEAGDLYFRFIAEGARITENAKTITNAVDNGSGLIRLTITGHGYTTNDWTVVESVGGTTEANNTWIVTVIDPNTIDLQGSAFVNAYTSGGTSKKVYTLTTPYLKAELADIRYTQDSENLYLVHPNHAPRVLTRTSVNSFTLTNFVFDGGPYQPLNRDETHTMTASATTGSITVTSSTAYFNTNMVGMYMRIGGTTGSPAEQGFVQFTGYNSTTSMNADVKQTLSGTTATDNWANGAWGNDPGWPGEVGFAQQRLIFAKTTKQPKHGWASAIGIPEDFSVSTNDDRAFSFVAESTGGDVIRWLTGKKNVLIGTSRDEFSLSGGTNGITPSSAKIEDESNYGSNSVRPVQAGKSVLYVTRTGQKLREMTFDLDADSYISPDLSLQARHVLEGNGIVEMAYQQERDSVLWMALEDGTLASMTWLKDQKVIAWATHTLPGAWVHSIISLPSNSATHDEVYLLVERTIDSTTVRYIERFSYGTFVDSNLQGAIGGKTISGLDHLEGETVSIIGDGAPYRNQVVVDGSVTVDDDENDITWAIVGLPITATAVPVEPEVDDGTGTTFGRKKRWPALYLRVLDTMSLVVNSVSIPERSTEDLMDTTVDVPQIQNFRVHPMTYANDAKLTIQQTLPLPATVLGYFGVLEIGD